MTTAANATSTSATPVTANPGPGSPTVGHHGDAPARREPDWNTTVA